ncbi:MAG TPA: helix-hairpin-helix domain-containing protein [Candidatus Eisenbacteria bacterium]
MDTTRSVTRPTRPRLTVRTAFLVALAVALGLAAPLAAAAKSKSASSKSTSASHTSSSHKVDVNTATEKELETLPGIGTVMAQKIISGRPYKSVADLKHAGIPQSTIDGLKGHAMASRVTSEPEAATTHKSSSHKTSSASSGGHAEESGRATATEKSGGSAGEHGAEAHEAKKSSGQKTFFGIPIGGSSKPAAKEEPAAAPSRAASSPPPSSASEHAAPAEQPPAKGMVWVNTDSKVYHYEGDRWYGATKHGKFVWEDQAIREGCRPSKTGGKP